MITEYTAVQPDESAAQLCGSDLWRPFLRAASDPERFAPFFMEMAQDDNRARPYIVAFYDALKAAGYKPEFHIYEHGGHGWSMRKQGTTSDHWIEEFYWCWKRPV
jgi:acetyl esterase/lipase